MQTSQAAPSRYRISPAACPSCLRPRSSLALDRAPPSPRSAFIRVKKLENEYARRLRSVAGHIGELVRGFGPVDMAGVGRVRAALDRYASLLTPWAEAVGARMVAEVAQRDERAWMRVASQMSRALKQEIASAPTGRVMRERMAEQVTLITSLPTEAGQRVHDLTLKGMVEGTRTDAIAAEIMRTGEVTKSRADLIARTEVSRTSTALTQARAEHIGSEGYLWRTVGDGSVRASHRAMAGKFVRWDSPPTLDNLTGHAGALPNCRCFCEPVIPD